MHVSSRTYVAEIRASSLIRILARFFVSPKARNNLEHYLPVSGARIHMGHNISSMVVNYHTGANRWKQVNSGSLTIRCTLIRTTPMPISTTGMISVTVMATLRAASLSSRCAQAVKGLPYGSP